MIPMRHAGHDETLKVGRRPRSNDSGSFGGAVGSWRRMSPGFTGRRDRELADVPDVVGHPVHQRVPMTAKFIGFHRAKGTRGRLWRQGDRLSLRDMATRAPRLARPRIMTPSWPAGISAGVEPQAGRPYQPAPAPFALKPVPTQSLFAALGGVHRLPAAVRPSRGDHPRPRGGALFIQSDFPVRATSPRRRSTDWGRRAVRGEGIGAPGPRGSHHGRHCAPRWPWPGSMGDDALVERLTVVRGVGRWTVEMLLLFPPRTSRRSAGYRPRRAQGVRAHVQDTRPADTGGDDSSGGSDGGLTAAWRAGICGAR